MQISQLIFIAVIISISALFQLPAIHEMMIWDRAAIQAGEVWRVVTGNLTHTNWAHFTMNSLALVVINYIFRDHFSIKRYAVSFFALSITVGVGMFSTDFERYAGLSGMLHGLFAVGSVRDIMSDRRSSWLLLAGLAIKVGHEQFFGASVSSAALINAQIATEAHLIGAIAGVLL